MAVFNVNLLYELVLSRRKQKSKLDWMLLHDEVVWVAFIEVNFDEGVIRVDLAGHFVTVARLREFVERDSLRE